MNLPKRREKSTSKNKAKARAKNKDEAKAKNKGNKNTAKMQPVAQPDSSRTSRIPLQLELLVTPIRSWISSSARATLNPMPTPKTATYDAIATTPWARTQFPSHVTHSTQH